MYEIRVEIRSPPLNCLAQAKSGQLPQVIVLDTASAEPAGNAVGVRAEALDDGAFAPAQGGLVGPGARRGEAFEAGPTLDRLGIGGEVTGRGGAEVDQDSHGEPFAYRGFGWRLVEPITPIIHRIGGGCKEEKKDDIQVGYAALVRADRSGLNDPASGH